MIKSTIAHLATPRDEREDGFTLIEILVVIIIIGILAAVAIPIFLNQQKTARDSATTQDVRNVATNVETLRVSNPDADYFDISDPSNGTATLTIGDATDTDDRSDTVVSVTDGTELAVVSDGNGGFAVYGYNDNGREFAGADSAQTYQSANGGIVGANDATSAFGG